MTFCVACENVYIDSERWKRGRFSFSIQINLEDEEQFTKKYSERSHTLAICRCGIRKASKMSSAYVGIHERYHHGASGRMAEYNAESINWDEIFGMAKHNVAINPMHPTSPLTRHAIQLKKRAFRLHCRVTRTATHAHSLSTTCLFLMCICSHFSSCSSSSSSFEIYGSNKFFKLSRDMLKRRPTNVIEIIHRQLLRDPSNRAR